VKDLLMEKIFHRVNQYLLFMVLITVVLYFGRTLLVPIAFAALLSMLMAPLCRTLDSKGFARWLSALTCVLVLVVVLLGVLAVIGGQFASFSKDIPKIEQKANEFVSQAQLFIDEKMNVSPQEQKKIVKEQTKKAQSSGISFIGKFFGGLTSTVASLMLTLVYTFLLLFSKEHFESFFLKLFKDEDPTKVKKVVDKISSVGQKYLTGRVMSIFIIATLYAIGLSIVGIKNAILLAGVAALLTVIPYVGTVLGGLFPVFMALATEDSVETALWVGVVLVFIQAMDNYFIEPNVVGGEVNLSALSSILSIIVGGLIWGVAGMILFLPLIGILKIVCDNVEPLKPIGYILGDAGDKKPSKIKEWFIEKFGKAKKSSRKVSAH
jgi:predicted PurR-regulated permease PerM